MVGQWSTGEAKRGLRKKGKPNTPTLDFDMIHLIINGELPKHMGRRGAERFVTEIQNRRMKENNFGKKREGENQRE
jgi:hypothetical protein